MSCHGKLHGHHVDRVSYKIEPNWTFLGVVWTTWGPFLDAQAGHSKYLGSVLGRLSKRCGVEASSGVNFRFFLHNFGHQNDAKSQS